MEKMSRKGMCKKREKMLDPGNLLMLIYLGFVAVFLIFGVVSESTASDLLLEEIIEPEDFRNGELLAVMDDGKLLPTPLLSQEVVMQVSGIVNRVQVVQRFVNNSEAWIEAVYIFPLPEESGVDHMRLRIGERKIEGKIVEKALAEKIHEKAKREGRKSSLIKQNRANVFTTKVANIGPGEEVIIEIEYLQTANYRDGVFSLRFPMVVGPRYVPDKQISSSIDIEKNGWAIAMNHLSIPSEPGPEYGDEAAIPVKLRIDLAAGIALSRVDSLYHAVTVQKIGDEHYDIELTGEVHADRDFVLEWEAERAQQPQAALFSESVEGEQYMLLMVLPPYQETAGPIIPREVVFVLDISGSMAGDSIEQAKKSIALALDSLNVLDSFNLIVFNNRADALFDRAKPANKQNINNAHEYINSLEAEGGTEMLPALKLALDGSHRHERLRQVVFVTDGAVTNEDELLGLIARRLGDSRLFTVGIGSAPNAYFMTRAARMGRGTFVYIGNQTEVKKKMEQLLAKLTSPVLSNISLNRNENDHEMEMYPSPIPDLYRGEPVFLALKTGWLNSALRLTGLKSMQPWEMIIDISTHGNRKGIAALWARKKIRTQMESLALGGDEQVIREIVLKTALEHHLVSRYTSLVGVDELLSRAGDQNVRQSMVKTHLPEGWQAAAVFGGGAQTASPAALRILLGLCLLVGAVSVYLGNKRYGRTY